MADYPHMYRNTGAIVNFEQVIPDNWELCPPSTNLWTVQIKNASNGEAVATSFAELYGNILSANSKYSMLVSNLWHVSGVKKEKFNENVKKFFGKADSNKYGIILCQSVTLPDLSVTAEQSYGELDNYRGFLMPGHTVNNRTLGKQVQLSFLGTNYDLKDMFFTPWCAAVAQQGLIEDDELPCLRADLYINLYSPNEKANEIIHKKKDDRAFINEFNDALISLTTYTANLFGDDIYWDLRKQIKVTRAYPIAINDVNGAYDYETENAGKFRVFNVDFNFDEISIEYHR